MPMLMPMIIGMELPLLFFGRPRRHTAAHVPIKQRLDEDQNSQNIIELLHCKGIKRLSFPKIIASVQNRESTIDVQIRLEKWLCLPAPTLC